MFAPPSSPHADALLSQQWIDNPYPLCERLRHLTPLAAVGDSGAHLVASWELIQEVLAREPDFSANLTGVLYRNDEGTPDIFDLSSLGANANVIATADEPDHSVHRELLQPRFKPSLIAELERPLHVWVNEALQPLLADGGGDVITLAEKIPALVVARLLGLPESDVDYFQTWAMMGGDMLAGEVTLQGLQFLAEESERMSNYLGKHLDAANGQIASITTIDNTSDSIMVILADGIRKGKINRAQALGIATVLFGAGGESTAALISSCLLWLAHDPEMADQLRQSPDLIPCFVEEIVRLDPPFKFHYRVVRRDCELGGYQLRKENRLLLLWASANRDSNQFEHPDQLLLHRKHPKSHMGFGRGPHFCIGAVLARLEAKVVLQELLASTRSITLGNATPEYAPSIFVRRLTRLKLQLAPKGTD